MDFLFKDIYFVLFSFLNDDITLILLCQVNQKFYKLCSVFGKKNNFNKIIDCSEIVKNGYLEVLVWARQNGCQWDWRTCAYAAFNGHLEILKWARQNGCEWNSWVCTYAAENGHLEILKWARQNGCEWNSNTCAYAALNGDIKILKWARQIKMVVNGTLIRVHMLRIMDI